MTCKDKIIELILYSPIIKAIPELKEEDLKNYDDEKLVKLFDLILNAERRHQKILLDWKIEEKVNRRKNK